MFCNMLNLFFVFIPAPLILLTADTKDGCFGFVLLSITGGDFDIYFYHITRFFCYDEVFYTVTKLILFHIVLS